MLTSPLSRLQYFLRWLGATLTDLGYLFGAAYPWRSRLWRWWVRRRYRDLANRYDQLVDLDATYFAPLSHVLPDLPPAAVVIEVGVGTGAATRLLRRQYPEAAIVAIDLSAPMLSHVARSDALAVVGDAFALPLLDEQADVVLIHNAPFALDEALRVLKTTGVAAVILSSAGRIPGALARRLIQRAGIRVPVSVREYDVGAGRAWVVQQAQSGQGTAQR